MTFRACDAGTLCSTQRRPGDLEGGSMTRDPWPFSKEDPGCEHTRLTLGSGDQRADCVSNRQIGQDRFLGFHSPREPNLFRRHSKRFRRILWVTASSHAFRPRRTAKPGGDGGPPEPEWSRTFLRQPRADHDLWFFPNRERAPLRAVRQRGRHDSARRNDLRFKLRKRHTRIDVVNIRSRIRKTTGDRQRIGRRPR